MSNYLRVLPRDLFNEAKLLKCLGKLTMLVEDRMAGRLKYQYDAKRFKINQDESGDIYCANILFEIEDPIFTPVVHYSPLNSKSNWPLVCIIYGDMYTVFDDTGELTEEFKKIIH